MSKPVRILDLDNCISDDLWRMSRIAWQHTDPTRRYHDYHSLAPFDNLRNAHLVDNARVRHVVFTARPKMFRAATSEWLIRNNIEFEHLIMRNDDDHMPSVRLKAKQLTWLLELYGVRHSEILDAYDDRPDVVEMYRQHGIDAHVAAIHSTCAMTAPAVRLEEALVMGNPSRWERPT